MPCHRRSRHLRGLATLAAVPLLTSMAALGWSVSSAYAAGSGNGNSNGATIDHVSTKAGQVQLLVSVPGTAPVQLSSAKVTIGNRTVPTTAQSASTSTSIARVAILAMDTSLSMSGPKITNAKAAALQFLQLVPADVKVGLVTFAGSVTERVAPTTSRQAITAAVKGLTLSKATLLYQGVQTAVKDTQLPGESNAQRQVLLMTDGMNTTHTSLSSVLSVLSSGGVRVDVVGLQQTPAGMAPLAAMAKASGGSVINASPASLTAAFTSEANHLARQVQVTATVPASQQTSDANVTVSLAAGGTTYRVQAFVRVKPPVHHTPPPPPKPAPVPHSLLEIPTTVMYAAVGAIGLGLVGAILALAFLRPSGARPASLEEQLKHYGVTAPTSRPKPVAPTSFTGQATQAAQKALSRNASLEARIATRLEAAGMKLKPAEWLLLHAGVAIGAGLLGFILSGGGIIAGVIFLLFGVVAPPVYLRLRQSRRLKAFDAGLADMLQLMSGSLSAGLSLAQSVDTIVREGVDPITSEFKRVIVESRLGVGLEDALSGVSERMQSEDFAWVVMAIRIQREVGGNLAELLNTVAGTLREREYLRRQVRALSAEGRLSCYVLGGLPPAFLVYLTLTKPTYVHPLYTTPIGWMMLGGAIVLLSVGLFWMTKVSKVEV